MKRVFRLGVLLLLMLLSAAASVCALFSLSPGGDLVPASAQTFSPDAGGYVLGLCDGELCVFDGGGVPVLHTGVSADELRDSDRLSLERGISAAGYEEILALLEDFNS
ncbi:MAG: hypothetical protein IJG63_05385 [Oscillospiraceae bacterium]|nr:hypothetical protein [Oscillospiraceae bacterium]